MKAVFIILCLLFPCIAHADIQSTSGNILFDSDNDGNAEVQLDGTGLGIGTSTFSSNLFVSGNALMGDSLYIGSSQGNSSLDVDGSMGMNIESVSSNTLLSGNSIILVDTASGNVTLTLPAASDHLGRIYNIKKASPLNMLKITGAVIDRYFGVSLGSENSGLSHVSLISNGNSVWYITNNSNSLTSTPSDNLIAWWNLDETSGTTTFDSSNSGINGTLTNGLTFSGCSVAGINGNALHFDGSDDEIEFGFSAIGNVLGGANGVSVAFWARTQSIPNSSLSHVVQGVVHTSLNNFTLRADYVSASKFKFRIGGRSQSGDSFQSYQSTTQYDYNTWYHVVGVLDYASDAAILYVNGSLEGSASVSFGSSTYSHGTPSGSNFDAISGKADINLFHGDIDDIRIYDRVVTAAEAKALYQQGNP